MFALSGPGRLALTAIGTRDFPLLQGEILSYAAAIVGLGFLSPYPALVPGLAVVATVLGRSLLGDGLRDLLDPRIR